MPLVCMIWLVMLKNGAGTGIRTVEIPLGLSTPPALIILLVQRLVRIIVRLVVVVVGIDTPKTVPYQNDGMKIWGRIRKSVFALSDAMHSNIF